ncbi:MAG: hypothetical protein KBT88_05910 [Gammaproteobacteria bacterium]|nr:hypothetical protein [Gammaproteobacteria bacterium]MBQ0839305.1 hypothetical protein [Gammaproteobacteria bacterium]
MELDKLAGFYTTRFILAGSPAEAEMKTLDNLRHAISLKLSGGISPSAEAKVYFEEIVEVPESELLENQAGFIYYAMARM